MPLQMCTRRVSGPRVVILASRFARSLFEGSGLLVADGQQGMLSVYPAYRLQKTNEDSVEILNLLPDI